LFSQIWTFYTIVVQFLHSLYFGRKQRIVRQISTAFMFLAWRKRITARISQLAGLSIAGYIIYQSVETRTSTRWPVMWWFTRQWIIWRYLACTCSPVLLH
jgi:hypothetical protein